MKIAVARLGMLFILCFGSTDILAENEQKARIVNAFFCDDAVQVDGWLQPQRVLYELKANHPASRAVFVLNLLLQPGKHEVEGRVLGPNGKQVTLMKFSPLEIKTPNNVNAVYGILRERLPTGMITVQVSDKIDGGDPVVLGSFSIPTVR